MKVRAEYFAAFWVEEVLVLAPGFANRFSYDDASRDFREGYFSIFDLHFWKVTDFQSVIATFVSEGAYSDAQEGGEGVGGAGFQA